VNENVLKILSDGLKPILCVGETQEEYNLKLNTQICAIQLSKGLKSVTKEQMKSVTIAYEPVRARARRHAGQPRGGAWGAGQGGAQGRAGRARATRLDAAAPHRTAGSRDVGCGTGVGHRHGACLRQRDGAVGARLHPRVACQDVRPGDGGRRAHPVRRLGDPGVGRRAHGHAGHRRSASPALPARTRRETATAD